MSEGINLLHIKGSLAFLFGFRNVMAYFSKIPMWWWYGFGGYDHLKTSNYFQKGICISSFSILLLGIWGVNMAMDISLGKS